LALASCAMPKSWAAARRWSPAASARDVQRETPGRVAHLRTKMCRLQHWIVVGSGCGSQIEEGKTLRVLGGIAGPPGEVDDAS